MKKGYTHLVVILDRSYSMKGVWGKVKEGVEGYINTNKEADGECSLTLVAFDDQYDVLEDFVDIQSVSGKIKVKPRGSTALRDAVGKTLVSVRDQIKSLPEHMRPEKVLVQIQTDGEENCSKEWTPEDLKKKIKKAEKKWGWDVTFIGATKKSITDAKGWGIKANKAAFYTADNADTMLRTMSLKSVSYRAGGDAGYSQTEREELNSV